MPIFGQFDRAFWGVFEIGVDQCREILGDLEPFAGIQNMHRTADLDLGIYAFVCRPWAAHDVNVRRGYKQDIRIFEPLEVDCVIAGGADEISNIQIGEQG